MAEDVDYDSLQEGDPIAFVRSLIPDMEKLDNPSDPTAEPSYLFSDRTLRDFIAFAKNNNPRRAAADACEAVAGSEALILKVLTTEDLATNGAALAKEWGAKATRLRNQAKDDEENDDDGSGAFSVPFIKRPTQFDPQAILQRNRFGFPRW